MNLRAILRRIWPRRDMAAVRLAELKQRRVQMKADYYDMRHWPAETQARMEAQIAELDRQIAHLETIVAAKEKRK